MFQYRNLLAAGPRLAACKPYFTQNSRKRNLQQWILGESKTPKSLHFPGVKRWARLVSNQRPLRCQHSANVSDCTLSMCKMTTSLEQSKYIEPVSSNFTQKFTQEFGPGAMLERQRAFGQSRDMAKRLMYNSPHADTGPTARTRLDRGDPANDRVRKRVEFASMAVGSTSATAFAQFTPPIGQKTIP